MANPSGSNGFLRLPDLAEQFLVCGTIHNLVSIDTFVNGEYDFLSITARNVVLTFG